MLLNFLCWITVVLTGIWAWELCFGDPMVGGWIPFLSLVAIPAVIQLVHQLNR